MNNGVKSSTVAGILGVFLGSFGGHDWYLGNSKKAITHVSLCVGGLILLMIGIILNNISKSVPVLNMLFIIVIIMAYVIIVGNLVWGMIEGIMILAQGDAGLEAKGYQVAKGGSIFQMASPNENIHKETVETAPTTTAISSTPTNGVANTTPVTEVKAAVPEVPKVEANKTEGAKVVTMDTAPEMSAASMTPEASVAKAAEDLNKTVTADGKVANITGNTETVTADGKATDVAGDTSAATATTSQENVMPEAAPVNAPGVQPSGAPAEGMSAQNSYTAGTPEKKGNSTNATPEVK